jgi:hypothetical protein
MTPRGGSPQLTIRQGSLAPLLAERVGGLFQTEAAVAKRDLDRYYILLASGQQEVQELGLTMGEAMAICDVLNGAIIMTGEDGFGMPLDPMTHIAMELHDGDRLNGLGEKWAVDVSRLITRLRTLTPLGGVALLDAVERFWTDTNKPAEQYLVDLRLVQPEA